MLKYAEIKNYQCHKDIRLDFVNGVNVIAGTSDAGKSAILRGILWCLTNKPSGIGMRHHDCSQNDKIEVTLGIDDHVLSRVRSEKENAYILDGETFVAMRSDVPSEISSVHNMEEINMQTQFQPHFLLSSSAGEVCKAMNAACDLSIIDKTIKGVKSIHAKAETEASVVEKEVETLKQQTEALAWVPDAQNGLQELVSLWDDTKSAKSEYDALNCLLERYMACEDELNEAMSEREIFASLPDIEKEATSLCHDQEMLDTMRKLLQEHEHIEHDLKEAEAYHLDMDKLERIEAFLENTRQKENSLQELKFALATFSALTRELGKEEQNLDMCQKEYNELVAKIGICPVCGNPM